MVEKDGYILRLARIEDVDPYYERNFKTMDKEVARFTGSKEYFEEKEVKDFFLKSIDESDRYDFLIINPKGEIIGESILSDFEEDKNSMSFRIAIFHSEDCNGGIGSWAMQETIAYAFETLHLDRIELEVYSYNPRAQHVYEKLGFKEEMRIREVRPDGDIIVMALLKEDYYA